MVKALQDRTILGFIYSSEVESQPRIVGQQFDVYSAAFCI